MNNIIKVLLSLVVASTLATRVERIECSLTPKLECTIELEAPSSELENEDDGPGEVSH